MIDEETRKFWFQIMTFLTKAAAFAPAVTNRQIMEQLQEVAFKQNGDGPLTELSQQELPDRAFCPKEWGKIAWRLIHPYSQFSYDDEDIPEEEACRLAEELAQENFKEILWAAQSVVMGRLSESPKLWGDPSGGYEHLSQ